MGEALLQKMMSIGELLYFEGQQIDLYECNQIESYRNALTLYEKMGYIEFLSLEGGRAGTVTGRQEGRRIVRLSHEMQSEQPVELLVNEVGKFKKKSRAYKSRRFSLSAKRTNDVSDAIRLVKEQVRQEHEEDFRAGRKAVVRLAHQNSM